MRLLNCDNLSINPLRMYGVLTGSKIAIEYNKSLDRCKTIILY